MRCYRLYAVGVVFKVVVIDSSSTSLNCKMLLTFIYIQSYNITLYLCFLQYLESILLLILVFICT